MKASNRLARSPGFTPKKSVLAVSAALCATIAGMSASAQDNTSGNSSGEQDVLLLEETLVTGSHIRGIEPIGAQTFNIDSDDIKVSGATTTNEVLGTLPQADNLFNNRATLNPRAQSRINIVRPNLRGLPGFEQASGAATLVLVDGHRITGMGVAQSAPDPDIVPPAVIERVEIIVDGGSSLYGADAVGGVINIVTKSDFEGIQIDGAYNTGDDYWGYDTNLTAGTDWEQGSGYISLVYSDRDSLLGKDRDWAGEGQWTDQGLMPNGTECVTPVGVTQNIEYKELVPGITVWDARDYPEQSVGERCDPSALATIFPSEERGSVFFGLTHDISADMELKLKGYYSERTTYFETYPLGDSTSFGPAQFSPTPAAEIGTVTERGSVGFSYAPNPAYRDRDGETSLETWGITPTLTVNLDNGWQLRNLLHYSQSESYFNEPGTNPFALNDAIANGSLDPLDVGAADPATVNDILNQELAGESNQDLFIARVIGDGSLFALPAGDLQLAAGLEYMEQSNELRQGQGVNGHLSSVDFNKADRDVKSAFIEFNVPILAGIPGIETLTASVSARYDDYSDFGDTTNPHVGLTWEPVGWLAINANWGESFVAPTLTDELNAAATFAYAANAVGIVEPSANTAGVTIEDGRTDVAFLNGAQPNLEPQTADTWSVGFEMLPPIVEGLEINASYYEIEFIDLLGGINPQLATAAVLFPDRYVWNPTEADLEAAAAVAVNGDEVLAAISDPALVATILDLRVGNTDESTLKGVDFGISYSRDTDLGLLGLSLSGTHRTEFELTQGGITGDELVGKPDTLATAAVSLQNGGWNGNLTWKYTSDFDVDDAQLGQTSVDDFQVIDLFVGYEFQSGGWSDGLSLRFRIDNLFDEEPPLYRLNSQPSYRGFTLGRVFGFGFTKRFD